MGRVRRSRSTVRSGSRIPECRRIGITAPERTRLLVDKQAGCAAARIASNKGDWHHKPLPSRRATAPFGRRTSNCPPEEVPQPRPTPQAPPSAYEPTMPLHNFPIACSDPNQRPAPINSVTTTWRRKGVDVAYSSTTAFATIVVMNDIPCYVSARCQKKEVRPGESHFSEFQISVTRLSHPSRPQVRQQVSRRLRRPSRRRSAL